jgi:two-component system sensor histidine kinase VicK
MRVGMRWWLALAFAAVAATTAVAVAQLSSARSEAAFRDRAEALAAGNVLEAAIELRRDRPLGRVAEERRLALFLYDEDGTLVSSATSRGVELADVPNRKGAVAEALRGRRVIRTDPGIRVTTVALPLGSDDTRVLLGFARHPELATELGIVREEIVRAAWIALLVGGAVGAVIATMIARRLRRIARAAAAIESGDFGVRLHPDFPDEVGDLAATVDRMRGRLRASFRQLEAERDRLGQLLERLNEGVVAVDEHLFVQFVNRAARSMLGDVDPGEPLPEPWRAVSLRGFAAGLFDARPVTERRVEADEGRVFALAGVAPDANEVAVIVLRDLTEEERRERAEREFVANASHELRTPLTTILGAVEVLQAGAKDDAAARDRFLAHIDREARRLVRLTRALLVLARAETHEQRPRLSAVPLRPLLDEIAATLPAHPGVAVSVECGDDVEVAADPDLLEQAIANVAANAAEHTRQGAIVLAAGSNGNGRVRIDVRDTGPGIPASLRARIFDRFYRPTHTSPEGFGLGLAIVRATVRAQNGTVELADSPGGGTQVTIELDRADP